MTALIIIAAVLLLLAAFLFLPLDVNLSFKESFAVKVKFAGFRVYKSKAKPQQKEEKPQTKATETQEKKKPQNKPKEIFTFLKEKYGFLGAVKSILGFAKDALSQIKKLLKHIRIKKVEFNLTVAGDDAAQTAIEYGIVCTAVYPLMTFLSSCADIGFKSINVKSDFNKGKGEFDFSATVRMRIFFLLIAAYKIYTEYNRFLLKENYNERK